MLRLDPVSLKIPEINALYRNRVGAVASWLVRSTPGLAGDSVLCSRHFTLSVRLSTQAYKWVLANLMLDCKRAMD